MQILLALTFDYGQRAASQEIAKAAGLSARLGIAHKVIALPWFKDFTRTSLLGGAEVPMANQVSIDDHQRSLQTAKAVWVPNRNGILLNIAAGFAEGLGADFIVPGFNREEATTFPDNSAAFLRSLDSSFAFSTSSKVKTKCYSIDFDKTQIVAEGLNMQMPFSDLWPCYLAQEKWCGECESCQRFKRALAANGLSFETIRGLK